MVSYLLPAVRQQTETRSALIYLRFNSAHSFCYVAADVPFPQKAVVRLLMLKQSRCKIFQQILTQSVKTITSILSAEDVEGEQHGVGERGGFLLAGKVEAVNLPGIPPLVEGWGSLVVL